MSISIKGGGTGGFIKFRGGGTTSGIRVPGPPPPPDGSPGNPYIATLGVPYYFTLNSDVTAIHATAVDYDGSGQPHYGKYLKFTAPVTSDVISFKYGVAYDVPPFAGSPQLDTLGYLFQGSTYDGTAPVLSTDDDGGGANGYYIFPNTEFRLGGLTPGADYIVEATVYSGGAVLSSNGRDDAKLLVETSAPILVPSGTLLVDDTVVATLDTPFNSELLSPEVPAGSPGDWEFVGREFYSKVPIYRLASGVGSPGNPFVCAPYPTSKFKFSAEMDIDSTGDALGRGIHAFYGVVDAVEATNRLINGTWASVLSSYTLYPVDALSGNVVTSGTFAGTSIPNTCAVLFVRQYAKYRPLAVLIVAVDHSA